jgi:predicted RNase H-like HicB family nuclease
MTHENISIAIENLPVQVIEEGEYFVFSSQVLEVSSYGKSFEEGKKNFIEALEIIIEEGIKDDTIIDHLTNLGWSIENDTIKPPKYTGTFNISLPEKSFA